jgi:hypothetical protein
MWTMRSTSEGSNYRETFQRREKEKEGDGKEIKGIERIFLKRIYLGEIDKEGMTRKWKARKRKEGEKRKARGGGVIYIARKGTRRKTYSRTNPQPYIEDRKRRGGSRGVFCRSFSCKEIVFLFPK